MQLQSSVYGVANHVVEDGGALSLGRTWACSSFVLRSTLPTSGKLTNTLSGSCPKVKSVSSEVMLLELSEALY